MNAEKQPNKQHRRERDCNQDHLLSDLWGTRQAVWCVYVWGPRRREGTGGTQKTNEEVIAKYFLNLIKIKTRTAEKSM